MGNINEELNALPVHSNRKGTLCGRRFPDTVLDIEGWIHHGEKLQCLDKKTCNRIRKKKG